MSASGHFRHGIKSALFICLLPYHQPEMTDEEIADSALSLSRLEQDLLLLCDRKRTLGYSGFADKLGVSYEEAQAAGRRLQRLRFATILTKRWVREFGGSGLYLTRKGEPVKDAVAKMRAW